MWLPRDVSPAGWLSQTEMARALGLLYAVGGSFGLVRLALPHEPVQADSLVAAMSVLAVVFGVAMAVRAPASTAALHGAIVVIQLVIAVAYVGQRDPAGDIRFFFVWATPYAAFYFGKRAAAAHTAWTAVVLAASLALMPAQTHRLAPSIYLATMGTVAATAALVSWASHKLRAAEYAQRARANSDPLTGLPNRLAFAARAAEAVQSYRDHGGSLVVMVLDLDRFKLVNDTYGHSFGDELLKAVVPRLSAAVAEGDLVVRLGGDEFGVLVHHCAGGTEVEAVAEQLSRMWREPFWINGVALHLSASIGIAVARSPDDNAESLLRDADAAMYATKQLNPGSWTWFDDRMREGMAERLSLEHKLSEAIARHELQLAYQPIVELATGNIRHAEVLLRWPAESGAVAPLTFITLAEETGLIFSIGSWVLENAATQLARWRADRVVPPDFVLTVNVAARQLQPGFALQVHQVLTSAGVPGSAIGLEVTETALFNDPETAAAVISDLRQLGLRCVLDDFGTGYSSLAHLQQFSLDAVKLDRTFVADIGPGRAPIVEAVIALGDALGLAVIAEGVETHEQARALLDLGCSFGQGYYFGAPVPSEQLESQLRAAPTVSRVDKPALF